MPNEPHWKLVTGAAIAFAVTTACTAAPTVRGGTVPSSGPPVIVPGEPGETARTASPGETLGPGQSRAVAADIRFVEAMIPHHRQALDMSTLVADRTGDAALRALARRIDVAQRPEITYMSTWLRDLGRRIPPRHGDHEKDMRGMATEAQLSRLRAARGEAFDRQFLQLMITHHEGALAMARPAVTEAGDRAIRQLARDIMSGQSAEIRRMRDLQ